MTIHLLKPDGVTTWCGAPYVEEAGYIRARELCHLCGNLVQSLNDIENALFLEKQKHKHSYKLDKEPWDFVYKFECAGCEDRRTVNKFDFRRSATGRKIR